jgi:hypothetical protein
VRLRLEGATPWEVPAVPRTKDELRNVVLNFYREELRRRYEIRNVRRFKPFDGVSDEQIAGLRDFFLDQIYPSPAKRQQLDDAFDRLGEMLRSPSRMRPLMGAALSSMWKLGHRLPAAVSAGKSTIDAYSKTRQLEQLMIEEAERQFLEPDESKNQHRMHMLIRNVPEEVVVQLIEDILSLFHALSNVEMLKVAASFMEQCVKVMEKRPDLYSDEDRNGIAYGLRLLRGGIALFMDMPPEHFPKIIEGIKMVEMDWYESVRQDAAA